MKKKFITSQHDWKALKTFSSCIFVLVQNQHSRERRKYKLHPKPVAGSWLVKWSHDSIRKLIVSFTSSGFSALR